MAYSELIKNFDRMRDLIIQKLKEIEQTENIRILHAVESGSRAWGFPSPDSDYDVRFIYVRPPEFYLKLEKTRDVIELPINDMLDINGWDLNKALRLLHSSNPTLFEWMSSPVVYHQTEYIDQLLPIMDQYFSCKSGLYKHSASDIGMLVCIGKQVVKDLFKLSGIRFQNKISRHFHNNIYILVFKEPFMTGKHHSHKILHIHPAYLEIRKLYLSESKEFIDES